jgi:SseB protein N-terminal domain
MADAREWKPANEVEFALLQAWSDGDERAYFQILSRAPLYLPASAAAQRRGSATLYSWESDGVRVVPVYTSVEALAHSAGGVADAYAVTTYPELAANWPDPAWKLAVDPNLSIGVYAGIEDVARGARGEPVVASAAGQGGGVQAYLRALLVSDVLVPTARPVPDPAEIAGPDFPWLPVPGRPDRAIAVFSSAERLAEGWPELPPDEPPPAVLVPFVSVAEFWPGPEYALVINAGTPLELTLPGDEVRELVDAMRAELTEPAPEAAPALEAAPEAEPAQPPPAAAAPLVVLQKVVAHGDVSAYLRDGHHLVTGFVYPAEELRHLTTPAALCAGLGLPPDGSPFGQTDAEVHVLRWLAHCPELYRLAVGGPDDATRLANHGWMVEPAPFRGTGLGAGDVAVPQLKVDSVALPHGAVLVKLTNTGQETVVASFDADYVEWLPVAPVDLGSMTAPES